MRYKAPRGTQDILPDVSPRWQYIEDKFRNICRLYGYKELRTPAFEETELFTRSIGEHTDIVSKEMYTFKDRADRSLTLRPEGTAPVVRAYIEHSLYAQAALNKLYYVSAIFRYERPQAGRYRQHHQVGVEAIGSDDPAIDAEVISLGMQYLLSLDIRNLVLKINSVGCPSCRPIYREVLKKSVAPYLNDLCENCRVRYEVNPLRMLDCKSSQCRQLTVNVPGSIEHLCEECSRHMNTVQHYLNELGIEYVVDPRLVRGFDYYTKTAFEVTSSQLGSQDAVLGGGRYDLLVEELGGPPTPAVGFGCGIERILGIIEAQDISIPNDLRPDIFVITLGDKAREAGIKLLSDFRKAGIAAEIDYTGKSMKAQMRTADKKHSLLTAIIGEEELAKDLIKIRNMETKEEVESPIKDTVGYVKVLVREEKD